MILDEPYIVTVARMRGNAWVYMALSFQGTGTPHFEYEIHTDRNHRRPAHLPLVSAPVWIRQKKLWEKKTPKEQREWLMSMGDVADRLEVKWGLKEDTNGK